MLDDVHVLFDQPIAQQILMAALGDSDSEGARSVSYRRQNREEHIQFFGSLVCISNLDLSNESNSRAPVLDALRSRIHVLAYAPTDEEMIALMRDVVRGGWQSPDRSRKVSREDCHQVLEFVIEECRRLGIRSELRMLLEKAIPDYWHWQQGETETHWEDLVRSDLEESVTLPFHATRPQAPLTRKSRMEQEQALVLELCNAPATQGERIQQYEARTGKNRRTFYRRVDELQNAGLLPKD